VSQRIVVDIHLSAEEYLRYYRGEIKLVQAIAVDGRRVRFPANVLQHVIGHYGIHGRYAIEFDNDGRFQSIKCVD
jgi:predicted ester cyclase